MTKETVKLNYLRIAPRKVRLVIKLLRGLALNEAQAELLALPQRAASVILKFLRGAEANIKNNHHKDPNMFYVESIQVDEAPMLKRMMPRARGRGAPIHKKGSHITMVLSEKEGLGVPRFKIETNKPRFGKKDQISKEKRKKVLSNDTEAPSKVDRPGFFQKVFRRKSAV